MKNIVSWKPVFTSILLLEDTLCPVTFDISIQMEVVSDSFNEQDIAMGRIQTIVESFFSGSLICEMNEFASELPYAFSNNVVAVPIDPTDHVLCGLLYTKCNAVAEGKIVIHEIKITSTRGGGLEYSIGSNSNLPAFLQPNASVSPWYLRNDSSFTDSFQLENKNVIHFPIEYCTWEELDLGWDKHIESDSDPNLSVIDFKSIKPNEN